MCRTLSGWPSMTASRRPREVSVTHPSHAAFVCECERESVCVCVFNWEVSLLYMTLLSDLPQCRISCVFVLS